MTESQEVLAEGGGGGEHQRFLILKWSLNIRATPPPAHCRVGSGQVQATTPTCRQAAGVSVGNALRFKVPGPSKATTSFLLQHWSGSDDSRAYV